jgi:hypothetical protein
MQSRCMNFAVRDDDSAAFYPKLLPAQVLRAAGVHNVSSHECAGVVWPAKADRHTPAAA